MAYSYFLGNPKVIRARKLKIVVKAKKFSNGHWARQAEDRRSLLAQVTDRPA